MALDISGSSIQIPSSFQLSFSSVLFVQFMSNENNEAMQILVGTLEKNRFRMGQTKNLAS